MIDGEGQLANEPTPNERGLSAIENHRKWIDRGRTTWAVTRSASTRAGPDERELREEQALWAADSLQSRSGTIADPHGMST